MPHTKMLHNPSCSSPIPTLTPSPPNNHRIPSRPFCTQMKKYISCKQCELKMEHVQNETKIRGGIAVQGTTNNISHLQRKMHTPHQWAQMKCKGRIVSSAPWLESLTLQLFVNLLLGLLLYLLVLHVQSSYDETNFKKSEVLLPSRLLLEKFLVLQGKLRSRHSYCHGYSVEIKQPKNIRTQDM